MKTILMWLLRWPQNAVLVIGTLAALDLGPFWLLHRQKPPKIYQAPDFPGEITRAE